MLRTQPVGQANKTVYGENAGTVFTFGGVCMKVSWFDAGDGVVCKLKCRGQADATAIFAIFYASAR